MKSKEKRKGIFIILILILLLVLACCLYHIYAAKNMVYASDAKILNENVQISDAQKVNIENIIGENSQIKKEEIKVEEEDLEYITEYKTNKELAEGMIQVVQEGRTGLQQVTIKKTVDENQNINEEILNTIVVKAAVNKIVEVGTAKNKYISKINKGSNIYVTSDRANIMKEAKEESEKITTITKETELKVRDIDGKWYKIIIDGQAGWIKAENVTSNNPNATNGNQQNNKVTQLDFNMELNKPSGLTLEQFKKVLTDSKDTKGIFSQNAEYFYYIESQYNINGLFVAAIGIHESSWGTSTIAQNKNNLFGYGAYDSSPYNSSYNFTTYSEGIDLIARVLVKYYLNPAGTAIYGGEQANGKYYSGNTLIAVNKKYATDKNWANKVYKNMEYLYKKI